MKTYLKSILRSVKNNIARFISIIVIMTLGIAFVAGLGTLSPTIKDSFSAQMEADEFYDVMIKCKDATGFTDETVDKLTALSEVEKIISEEKNRAENIVVTTEAVNPIELLKSRGGEQILSMLLDDKRGLIYGYDSFLLYHLLGSYYNSLYDLDKERADKLWRQIEALEEKMENYYLPATYTVSLRAMISKDALTRTQLKDTVMRCRRQRNNLKQNGEIK